MNENPKMILLTAQHPSEVTGRPHRVALNIADIMGVEETNYQYARTPDEIAWAPGTSITVRHPGVDQFDCSEEFDTVLALIRLAAVDNDWDAIDDVTKNNLQLFWASQETRQDI